MVSPTLFLLQSKRKVEGVLISQSGRTQGAKEPWPLKMLKSPFGLLHYDWFTDCETLPTNIYA